MCTAQMQSMGYGEPWVQAALGFLPENGGDSCLPDTGVKLMVATAILCQGLVVAPPEGGRWAGISLYVRCVQEA